MFKQENETLDSFIYAKVKHGTWTKLHTNWVGWATRTGIHSDGTKARGKSDFQVGSWISYLILLKPFQVIAGEYHD